MTSRRSRKSRGIFTDPSSSEEFEKDLFESSQSLGENIEKMRQVFSKQSQANCSRPNSTSPPHRGTGNCPGINSAKKSRVRSQQKSQSNDSSGKSSPSPPTYSPLSYKGPFETDEDVSDVKARKREEEKKKLRQLRALKRKGAPPGFLPSSDEDEDLARKFKRPKLTQKQLANAVEEKKMALRKAERERTGLKESESDDVDILLEHEKEVGKKQLENKKALEEKRKAQESSQKRNELQRKEREEQERREQEEQERKEQKEQERKNQEEQERRQENEQERRLHEKREREQKRREEEQAEAEHEAIERAERGRRNEAEFNHEQSGDELSETEARFQRIENYIILHDKQTKAMLR